MKVAIQGELASYHYEAAQKFFDQDVQIISCKTFKDTFEALSDGTAEYAVVAIENSLYGSINEVYDLLLKSKKHIIGETYLRINHQLIGLPNAKIENLKEIHTHRVAFAQCEEFIESKLAHTERFEHHDTAGSVADIKKWNDPTKAAIASKSAAKIHDLSILKSDIESNKENYTRFVLLSATPKKSQKNTKTSLVLTTKQDTQAGTLYQALGTFSSHEINLTMLQSRPIIGKAWHYMFYVDIELSESSPLFNQIQNELHQLGYHVTVLGSYNTV